MKFNLFKLFLLLTMGCSFTSQAQQNMRLGDLIIGDSVRLQTTLGMFFYGYFAGSNDSLFKFSYQSSLNDIKYFKTKQVAEVLLLARAQQIEKENLVQTEPSVVTKNEEEVSAKYQPESYTNQAYETSLPKNRNMTKQILAGAGGGYLGAVGGAFAGAFIGDALDPSPYSYDGSIIGAITGAIAGSILLNATFVYQIGNTDEVKGKFLPTLGGTALGMIVGIVMYPISPVAAAAGGVIAFNKSRRRVVAFENYQLQPKP
jgi:hypothetical protein